MSCIESRLLMSSLYISWEEQIEMKMINTNSSPLDNAKSRSSWSISNWHSCFSRCRSCVNVVNVAISLAVMAYQEELLLIYPPNHLPRPFRVHLTWRFRVSGSTLQSSHPAHSENVLFNFHANHILMAAQTFIPPCALILAAYALRERTPCE